MDWLICIALTAVGSIGLSYPETAARLGLIVNKHREVPFGTLLSLAELIGGVALAGYWLGLYAAIAVWPAGSVVAFILTLAMGGHVQGVWLLAQVVLLLWGLVAVRGCQRLQLHSPTHVAQQPIIARVQLDEGPAGGNWLLRLITKNRFEHAQSCHALVSDTRCLVRATSSRTSELTSRSQRSRITSVRLSPRLLAASSSASINVSGKDTRMGLLGGRVGFRLCIRHYRSMECAS